MVEGGEWERGAHSTESGGAAKGRPKDGAGGYVARGGRYGDTTRWVVEGGGGQVCAAREVLVVGLGGMFLTAKGGAHSTESDGFTLKGTTCFCTDFR